MSELQLSYRQLSGLKEQVAGGTAIRDALKGGFPNNTIAIIRGYNYKENEAYTNGAFFDEEVAEAEINEIIAKGPKPNRYHIVTGTISDLEQGKITDEFSGMPLNELDITVVYEKLGLALEAIDE